MSDDEPTFETADAGASHTYPMQAGALRKGGHAMLKGFPCKIADIATSKTGKHGHAKCNITGIDIFTGKKYEDMCPASHNMEVPTIKRMEYQLIDVGEDGQVSLLDDSSEMKEDLNLPTNTDGTEEEVSTQIRAMYDEGKDAKIVVLCACGQEKIIECRNLNV